ncbi:MAG: hypothetical protein NVSMB9_04570 [Isosphaeraceae bacterium]
MNASMDRAMKMAVVTGLRAALGPALLAHSQNRPEKGNLALAALGEMVFDKLPLVPGRDSLLPLLARGVAGAWVAHECCEQGEGEKDPWAAPLGAAVAMGVAVAAPKIRRTLGWTTGMPQVILGLIEDYIALRIGSEAVGLSMDQVTNIARASVDELQERFHLAPPSLPWSQHQHSGAGSM